jgi:hypothetical protein
MPLLTRANGTSFGATYACRGEVQPTREATNAKNKIDLLFIFQKTSVQDISAGVDFFLFPPHAQKHFDSGTFDFFGDGARRRSPNRLQIIFLLAQVWVAVSCPLILSSCLCFPW